MDLATSSSGIARVFAVVGETKAGLRGMRAPGAVVVATTDSPPVSKIANPWPRALTVFGQGRGILLPAGFRAAPFSPAELVRR